MDLTRQEREFQTTIQTINERSHLHGNIVQPLLAQAGVVEGHEYTEEFMQQALGRRFAEIGRITEEAISRVDRAVEAQRKLAERLKDAFVELYPKASFMDFED